MSGQFALLGFEALLERVFFSVVAALVFHFGEWDSNRLEAQVAAEKTILVVEKRDDRMSRGEELTKHMSQSIYENLCCVTLFFIIFQSGSLKKSQFFLKGEATASTFSSVARCLKIKEKVSFNIASETSYVYILSGQKFSKNAKMVYCF